MSSSPRMVLAAAGALGATVCMPLSAQRTWIVDELGRPGTDFADIPAAYAAAASGDVIRVRPDDQVWPHYLMPVIDGKGVDLVGEPGSRPWIRGEVVVRNIAATERVLLAHLEINSDRVINTVGTSPPPANVNIYKIDVRLASGPVVWEHIAYGNTVFPTLFDSYRFQLCDFVQISNSSLKCMGSGLFFQRGHVVLDGCLIEGYLSDVSGVRTAAVTASDGCRLHISRSTLRGQDASPTWPSRNGAGLKLCDVAEAWVTARSTLAGGRDLFGNPTVAVGGARNCGSYLQTGDRWLHRDASTVLVGPTYPGSVNFLDDPGPVAGLHYRFLNTFPGQELVVTQHAEPTNPVMLFASTLIAQPWASPGGPAFLEPATITPIDFGIATFAGEFTRRFPVPPTIPLGTTVAMQALELRPANELDATNVVQVGIW